jgi:hypothetical protein
MSHYKQDTNGAMATTEPLFASVWLALYNELRKNYIERRSMKSASSPDSQAAKKK